MTPSSVGALYDALLTCESPRRGDQAYPVHKRLRFVETQHEDIYDWVSDRLELRSTDRVLDVGCGVGFGTIRLAERGVARATGLTISQRELIWAARAASRSTRSDDIEFLYGSFDELPRAAFDVVVAVESLKHSPDLDVTLRAVRGSLAPGGRLVIVEDVFGGAPGSASARGVASDWSLTRLYREADYVEALGDAGCRAVDLTAAVRRSGAFALAGKLGALNMAMLCQGPTRAVALRAFRGGLHLEKLYAVGAMRYLAFFSSMDAGESR